VKIGFLPDALNRRAAFDSFLKRVESWSRSQGNPQVLVPIVFFQLFIEGPTLGSGNRELCMRSSCSRRSFPKLLNRVEVVFRSGWPEFRFVAFLSFTFS